MASSSACSLSKSLTGRANDILAIKHKEVKHSITAAVSGPSASQLRAEAAALCNPGVRILEQGEPGLPGCQIKLSQSFKSHIWSVMPCCGKQVSPV
jgi:hypothetical protein